MLGPNQGLFQNHGNTSYQSQLESLKGSDNEHSGDSDQSISSINVLVKPSFPGDMSAQRGK